MTVAAGAFVDTLDAAQRELATLPFAAPSRQDWDYRPRGRACRCVR